MYRRTTLKLLGATALGLTLPALAYQPSESVPLQGTAPENVDCTAPAAPPVACKIIGVGGAGCNIAIKAYSSGLLHAADCHPQFACVSMERQSIQAIRKANRLRRGVEPIRPSLIGRFGAHGSASIALAAAQKHDGALRALIDGADVVILVAGIGGGTGSAVAPILARMAEESGALVMGVIVTPFRWEIGRYPNAFAAVKALERHSHYLTNLSDTVVGELIGEDATLEYLIQQQELLGPACIHKLMVDGSRFCIDRWRSRPA